MKSPFEKKVMFKCSESSLEEFIESQYGHRYEIAPGEETSNDTALTFNVNTKYYYDHSKKDVQEFRESGKGSFLLGNLLHDMCDRGVLEEGEYVVDVSW